MNSIAASHDVLPFPYDWRISIQVEAKRFALDLTKQLEGSALPVRILAHSLGGLVARLAFAQNPDLFQRFKARDGCRLVMLGTPSRGSLSIARMLMGKDQTTGLLALLDFENREKDLLNMIRRFPGVLELLPADGPHDFFDERVWKVFDDTDGRGWQEPVGSDLVKARQTWKLLNNAPIDGATMVYVAGQAASTPVDIRIDGNRVRFQATGQGDGRVPWATGLLKGVPTFYARAAHGDLPRLEQAFGAYLDLLQQGTTRLLSSTQPVVRGGAMPFDLPDDKTPIFPDAEALEAAALGGQARLIQTSQKARPLTIRLRHGDLAFSPFPVMVGHYEQDSLNGSERYLDKSLDRRLSDRYQRDLYPGPVGTAEVILNNDAFPPGAVVIGIGKVGGLTTGRLKRAILHGLRRYCLTAEEHLKAERRQADGPSAVAAKPGAAFGLSALIIGSGDGGMGMDEALTALLDALLQMQRDNQLGGLTQLEIIEYAEHRAIGAMRELMKLKDLPRYNGHLEIDSELKEGEGGIRQLVLEADKGWARRIEIKEAATADQRYRGLHYAVLTGRARIEDNLVADTLTLADAFIDAAIAQTTFGGQASPGRTLFELLLPLRIKLVSDEDRNLVLMLDRVAASYPWELLEDKSDDQARPPAIRAGLIRQLHDDRYRPEVVTTNQRTALVVGDPAPLRPHKMFPALDGAVREARSVADLIGGAGYAVDEEIRTRPTSAVATLMSGQYRIIHLAGHGVFEQSLDDDEGDNDERRQRDDGGKALAKRTETGMVLGDGLFLTVGAVNQLTHVPELVFLNCCYLGRIDARAEQQAANRFNELAANLGTQFIRIGAKAVIAAGWAVDDDAANTFATSFYHQMLDQHATFMDAVRKARLQTYTAHPGTNTWGAYQAYGDPTFTLNGKRTSSGGDTIDWHLPYEAVLAFEELAQRAQTMARSDWDALKYEFHALWQRTPKAWWQHAGILAAMAITAGELGLIDDALTAYDRAIAAEKSDAPIKAIQQRANLRARYAVYLAKGKVEQDPLKPVDPLGLIVTSWTELEKLTALQKLDASPDEEDQKQRDKREIEQLTFLGSAAKRAAQLYVRADKTASDIERDKAGKNGEAKDLPHAPDLAGHPKTQIDWLKLSADCYQQAHAIDPTRAYALTNWLTAAALIRLRGGKAEDQTVKPPTGVRLETLLSDADRTEHLADLERPDFWALGAKGDIALTRLLLETAERLANPKGEQATKAYEKRVETFVGEQEKIIANAYANAWNRGGSVLKMNSILEQLDSIIDALSIGQSDTNFERQRLIATMQYIEEDINQKVTQDG